MPRRESHLHGLLLVDKPGLEQVANQNNSDLPSSSPNEQQQARSAVNEQGATSPRLYTSHDIVQLVRKWSGQRRIGHTGTLDPMASGLMVLCLGQATRLVEYYQGHDKVYLAQVTLGVATDSYDAVGQVTKQAPIYPLTQASIEQALQQFQGDILQLPPIYSALKQGGESLHRKARRGEEVAVEPRPITIHHIDLIDFTATGQITLRVHCSAGTYIRSLAHDLGEALGTCAHLSMLRREQVGHFQLDDALTLPMIEAIAAEDQLESSLIPLGTALDLPIIQLTEEWQKRFGFGQKVPLPAEICHHICFKTDGPILAQAHDFNGNFLGILGALEWTQTGIDGVHSLWKAEKWLATQES